MSITPLAQSKQLFHGSGYYSNWTGATWSAVDGTATNAPSVGAEKVTNGNMETGSPPTSWTVGNAAVLATQTDERTGGAGTKSISVARNGNNFPYATQTIAATVGKWYSVSAWVKRIDATKAYIQFDGNSSINNAASTSWALKPVTSRATTTTPAILLLLDATSQANGVSGRFDDVTIKEITTADLFRSIVNSTQNVIADANVTLTLGTQAGLVINLDSASSPANFVIAYHDGTSAKLDKCVNGVYTNLLSASATYSIGATIRVVKDGTAYRLFYNNVVIGASATVADAGIVDNKLMGLFSTYSGNSLTNFKLRNESLSAI